ncbi:MAG: hypothetical protein WA191_17545 [Telluria sp.]|nr:hypothetical protein [Telluria sp.]
MTRTVLLARPHPFIVAEMKPFLEHGGYASSKLESLTDLAVQAPGCVGAVISLAVSSSVGTSAGDVFTRLHQEFPRVPVLFASMLELDAIQGSLARIARNAGVQATIIGVASGNENAGALRKPGTFVYISKADLADPTRRAIAARIVQRHFL